MPVKYFNRPAEVHDLIEKSTKPVIAYYWINYLGEEPPVAAKFQDLAEEHGEKLELVIADGFTLEPHGPNEIPLAVLYNDGKEVQAAGREDSVDMLIAKALNLV